MDRNKNCGTYVTTKAKFYQGFTRSKMLHNISYSKNIEQLCVYIYQEKHSYLQYVDQPVNAEIQGQIHV